MGKIIWEDYPSPKNLFTKRNAIMKDLETNKTIQYYSANTKIVIVQKAQVNDQTFLRTASARDHDLDWAFEASAFGLPNDVAPPVHVPSYSLNSHTTKKQKPDETQKPEPPKGGEETKAQRRPKFRLLGKLFGRKKV